MQRRSPLKRTGFKPRRFVKSEGPTIEREPRPLARAERAATYAGTTVAASAEPDPVRHEGYRRLVAKLPCKRCGIYGYSQAAHPNTGKGAGTKTDDRKCFPLCTVHPVLGGLITGCHEQFDQGALFTKAERRALEEVWSADTRRTIFAMGLWPSDLPMLEIECQSRRN
jgi:hypothetical protein